MFVLQTAHGQVISRRQSVERMTELQQSKYQDLQAGLPSELSMQLAEVALALGSAEDQVTPLSLICVRLNSLSTVCSSEGCVK